MTYDFNSLIGKIKLSEGAHENAEDGMCAMEFVSWLEGEKFSDRPSCTCPVIAAFVRCANDRMDQAGRDRLLPYLPRIVGTVSKQHEQERAEFLAWQAIRVFAPNALVAVGLKEHAENLKSVRDFDAAVDAAADAYAAARAARAAYAAARAVAYAAYAARAARAANAAATCAANAATCAANAANTNWDELFYCLEGMLEIGSKTEGFSQPVEPVIEQALALA